MISSLRILLLEDEQAIADTIQYRSETDGHFMTHVTTCQAAREMLEKNHYDLAVFDVGLPDGSGLELCKELRSNSQMPIVLLTALDDEIDRVLGLELGADDYVTKPFSPRELMARIKAIMRRTQQSSISNVSKKRERGNTVLLIDTDACRVYFHDKLLPLSTMEYKILLTLDRHPGRVFSRDQLLTAINDDPGSALDRVIDAHIKAIRAKMNNIASGGGSHIETRRGLGYSLKPS